MDDAKELTNQYRIEHWAAVIQDCVNSGKSAKDWCTENNILRDRYYYWLRKVKLATGKGPLTKIQVSDTPKIVPFLPDSFTTVGAPCESLLDPAAIIVRSNGLVLEIKNNATEAVIGRVLKVLKQL